MPAFLTHFSILDRAVVRCSQAHRSFLGKTRPNYQPPGQKNAIAQTAYLGAMGPDWAAYNQEELGTQPAGTIFDMVHRKKSGVVVANILEETRLSLSDLGDSSNGLAFAMGYMAHIIGDAICHPYVNNIAGEYHNQGIKSIFEAAKVGGVTMHMFCEGHMDSYVAGTHYGAGDQMSNGPGDSATASWSDFLDDLVTGGVALFGIDHHEPTAAMEPVVKVYTDAIKRAYPGMPATTDAFNIALSNLFDVLDLAYDIASMHEVLFDTPPMDWWNLDFVEHKHYRNAWFRFDDLCDWAANVLAQVMWPAAWVYYHSAMKPADRKKFLGVMRNWNLDTGYDMSVYSKGDTIRILYDHSWAVFDKQRPPQLSISQLNDKLMARCRRIAEISNDFDRDAENRQVVARLTQQHIDDGDHIRTYIQDDNDYGIVRVKCELGKIRVTTSAAVWDTYTTLDQVVIPARSERVLELKTMDSTHDQTNRVVIETVARVSRYDIEFISWDR